MQGPNGALVVNLPASASVKALKEALAARPPLLPIPPLWAPAVGS